jgi:hypothetical protein
MSLVERLERMIEGGTMATDVGIAYAEGKRSAAPIRLFPPLKNSNSFAAKRSAFKTRSWSWVGKLKPSFERPDAQR